MTPRGSPDETSQFHDRTKAWLEETLKGPRRVGIPWASFTAFLRISTNLRALDHVLAPAEAWEVVERWLDAPNVWVPAPGPGHREILGRLVRDHALRANLVPDAVLAALCIEHGLQMVSADTDFARFPSLSWFDPSAP